MILHYNKNCRNYVIWAQLLFFIPNLSFWNGCKPMFCDSTWEKMVVFLISCCRYSSLHWQKSGALHVCVSAGQCLQSEHIMCVCFSQMSCVQIMLDSDLSLSDPLSYCTYGVITLYKCHNTACVHSVLYVYFLVSCRLLCCKASVLFQGNVTQEIAAGAEHQFKGACDRPLRG